MRKNFLTGLVILIPIALTFMIIRFLINLLTRPFLGIVERFLPIGTHQLAFFMSQLLILCGLVLICWIAGFLGKLFIGDYIFRKIDSLLHRTPFIRRIYKVFQESVRSLFEKNDTPKFSRVVLVPFFHNKYHTIGFVTHEGLPEGSNVSENELISVFIPGSPFPTIGFLVLYPSKDVLTLSLSVEEGSKWILSCGAKCPIYTFTPHPTFSL